MGDGGKTFLQPHLKKIEFCDRNFIVGIPKPIIETIGIQRNYILNIRKEKKSQKVDYYS